MPTRQPPGRCAAFWARTAGGYFLTPPVGDGADVPALLAAAVLRMKVLAYRRPCWAVAECTDEASLPVLLRQGFALRALRPLDSLAPCFLLQAGCLPANQPPVWVPLEDRRTLALWLARGYAALESRESPQGTVLALYPL